MITLTCRARGENVEVTLDKPGAAIVTELTPDRATALAMDLYAAAKVAIDNRTRARNVTP
jgi:hypothetical protein